MGFQILKIAATEDWGNFFFFKAVIIYCKFFLMPSGHLNFSLLNLKKKLVSPGAKITKTQFENLTSFVNKIAKIIAMLQL